jgi:hypothetical protein
MPHATLADVWNQAAGAASRGIEMITREQQYHLDTKLYEQAQGFALLRNKLAEDLTRVDDSGEMPYLNNPGEYRKYVEKSLADWKQNALRAGNGSRYYNDSLERIALQGQTAMQTKIYEAERTAEKQRAAVDFQKRLNIVLNQPGMTPKGREMAALYQVEEYAKNNGLDIEAKAKLTDGIYGALLGRELSLDHLNEIKTTAEWADYVRNTGSDKKYKDHVSELQNILETATGAGIKQIQQNNYNEMETADALYRAALRDGNYAGAAQITGEWVKRRDEAIEKGSPEYNRENYPSMAQMFPPNDPEDKKRPVDGARVRNILQMGVDSIFRGDAVMDAMTLSDLNEGSVDFVYNALTPAERKYVDSRGGKEWLYDEFYTTAFRSLQEYINKNAETNSIAAWATDKAAGLLDEKLDDAQKRILSDFMRDVAQSITYPNSVQSEKYLKDKAQRAFELVKAEHLSGFGNPSFTDVETLARSAFRLQENPEAVYTDTDRNVRFLNDSQKADIEQYRKEEQTAISIAYGYPAERLVHTWESEEGQKNDVTGKGEYIVLDEKGNHTNMRLRFTGEETGNILKKYQGHFQHRYLDEEGNGEWQEHTPGKKESALMNQQEAAMRDREEVERLGLGTTNGKFRLVYGSETYDMRSWNALEPYHREGIIQNILKNGLNPGIPETEWNKLGGFEARREAILDFFRSK